MIKKESVIMEEKKTTTQYSLIAGILFVILALRQLVYLVRSLSWHFNIFGLIWFAAYACVAIALITRKSNTLTVTVFAVLAFISLVSLIRFPSLYDLLAFLAYIGITAIAVVSLTDALTKYKKITKQIWFIPAVLYGTNAVYMLILHYGVIQVLFCVLGAVGLLFSALWVASPDGLPKKEATYQAVGNTGTSVQATNVVETTNEAYCSLVKHILLLLFTFGVWHCIWIYRMTRYTNAVQDEEPRNSTNKLLLCLFVPFYLIYWTYKTAQRVDKMAAAKGISSDMSTLCLILEIFVPIIPPVLLQDKMNNIVTAGDAQPVTVQNAPQKAAATLGTADELKTYKELLDSGVISQEEFDAKKKQLLGL